MAQAALLALLLLALAQGSQGFVLRHASLQLPKRSRVASGAAPNARFARKISMAVLAEAPATSSESTKLIAVPERFMKATKQLATLGPASSSLEMIEKLFIAGADVFRLNFSHGKHEEKAELVKIIREIERKYNHPIAILADLQGPKLRVDVFEHDKVELVDGQKFRFDLIDEPGDATRVKLPHPEIINTLDIGDTLLLDDGKLRMQVIKKEPAAVETVVINGGTLSNRKGVNTPSVVLPISPLTPKDRKDLEFALSCEVDWVALSFVQKPEDMIELRELVGTKAKLMAKLEKPAAIDALDDIVHLSDGIMVARGDLGVEMNPWEVPVIQKRITDTCRLVGKPVVIATQMLESMISSPTPTRAEASDVATAIYDGADAVMLSAESAAGRFPVESVQMQQRIIACVEGDEAYRHQLYKSEIVPEKTATDAITYAARQVAQTVSAKALVVFTSRGTTVLRSSKGRPGVPILAVTPDVKTARALAMVWGVYPIAIDHMEYDTIDIMLTKACQAAKDKGFVKSDKDLLVVTAGLPFGTPGASNMLRVMSGAGPDGWDSTFERPSPPLISF